MLKYLLFLFLYLHFTVAADTLTRDSAIAFVLREEGKFDTLQGVVYRYGLSDKYYPNIRIKYDAIVQYQKLWVLSGASSITDNTMAFIYFDTAILFDETTGQQLLIDCDYSWIKYLVLRLKKHYENCLKYPWLRKYYHIYVGRVIRLFDRFNKP